MNERCEICDTFDCECQSIIDEIIAEEERDTENYWAGDALMGVFGLSVQ